MRVSTASRWDWLQGLGLYLILGLTATVYWPGLYGEIILDDYANLEPLLHLDSGDLTWGEVVFGNSSGPLGRPLSMASFALDWLATGGQVFSLKLTNLALHLIGGALLFWLLARLLRPPLTESPAHAGWLALWAAALWLLAPMQVSTVLYLVQRMTELAAVFSLAGLLAYVAGRQRMLTGHAGGALLAGSSLAVFWPLATFSKENGALLPLLALVIEAGLLRFRGGPPVRRFLRTYYGVAFGLAGLAVLAWTLRHPHWLLGGYAGRSYTAIERLLTEARVLFDYLGNLLLLPGSSPLGIYRDDFPLSTGLLSPLTTLPALLAWLALPVLAWRWRGRPAGYVLAGLVLYLAAQLMESTLLPLEPYFEHRAYLPGAGAFLGLALGLYYLRSHLRRPSLLVGVMVLMVVVDAGLTFSRALIWRTWGGVLHAAEQNHPRSSRVQSGLANLALREQDAGAALAHLDRLEGLRPEGERAAGLLLHRIAAYCVAGRPAPDAVYARLAALGGLDGEIYTLDVLRWLTDSVLAGRCSSAEGRRLADTLERLLRGAGEGGGEARWQERVNTARLLAHAGRIREALAELDRAWAILPHRLTPGLLAIDYRLRLGDRAGALGTLLRLEESDRGGRRRHSELVAEYRRQLLGERPVGDHERDP